MHIKVAVVKIEWRNNQDFFAGLMFSAIGVAAMAVSLKNYPIGTSFRMGPGYFPAALGGILTALGLYNMLRSVKKGKRIQGAWGIRPLLLITLGVAAFGFSMDRFGLVPSLAVMFFLTTLGGRDFDFREVLVLTIVMTVAAWGIFIFGLGLPYRLFFWRH